MIQFNKLSITPDNKHLIIDVSIEDSKYFSNVYIDTIIIDNQNTFTPNGPSESPVYSYIVDSENKQVSLILSEEDLNSSIGNNMFFVYVKTYGEPSTAIPENLRKPIAVGTVVNLYNIYNKAMKYTRELNNTCNIPKNFIDYILQIKAIDLSIRTGNYLEAIKHWNHMFNTTTSNTLNCSCYESN